MAKVFYTEHDIDDMKARGVTSIEVHDGIVLTDLAVERALKHGIQIKRAAASVAPPVASKPTADNADLAQRVKAAVLAKLDGPVDTTLLDAVIAKVLAGMK